MGTILGLCVAAKTLDPLGLVLACGAEVRAGVFINFLFLLILIV